MSILLKEAAAAAKAAKAIFEKADREGREMTAEEKVEFQAKYSEATSKKSAHDTAVKSEASKDASVLAQAKALADLVGGPGQPPGGGRHWAKDAALEVNRQMRRADGQKAVVTGTYGIPNVIDADVVSIGRVPTSLLDLLDVVGAKSDGSGGNTFSYLRQTVRTNNAAVVADNATKPTSVATKEEIEDRFRVIAHLSEAIPKRYFDDDRDLESWLESEMEYMLLRALEAEILSGDGTGEHFTGILETSGIVTQAFSNSMFESARKAKTTLVSSGYAPTAYVLNPVEDEAADLAQDAQDRFYADGPFASGARTLWGLPRVVSTAVPAGTILLGDWKLAQLIVREDAELSVDASGVLFEKNQVKLRYEGRYGLAVKQPAAFAEIAATGV